MISSFLLQDIPRHNTRLFEVREAFKRTSLLGFCAYIISAYIVKKTPPAALPGGHARLLRSPQQRPDHYLMPCSLAEVGHAFLAGFPRFFSSCHLLYFFFWLVLEVCR